MIQLTARLAEPRGPLRERGWLSEPNHNPLPVNSVFCCSTFVLRRKTIVFQKKCFEDPAHRPGGSFCCICTDLFHGWLWENKITPLQRPWAKVNGVRGCPCTDNFCWRVPIRFLRFVRKAVGHSFGYQRKVLGELE